MLQLGCAPPVLTSVCAPDLIALKLSCSPFQSDDVMLLFQTHDENRARACSQSASPPTMRCLLRWHPANQGMPEGNPDPAATIPQIHNAQSSILGKPSYTMSIATLTGLVVPFHAASRIEQGKGSPRRRRLLRRHPASPVWPGGREPGLRRGQPPPAGPGLGCPELGRAAGSPGRAHCRPGPSLAWPP